MASCYSILPSTFETIRENIAFSPRRSSVTGRRLRSSRACCPTAARPFATGCRRRPAAGGSDTSRTMISSTCASTSITGCSPGRCGRGSTRRDFAYGISYAWDELETIVRLVAASARRRGLPGRLRALTAEANERLFRLVEESSLAFERRATPRRSIRIPSWRIARRRRRGSRRCATSSSPTTSTRWRR